MSILTKFRRVYFFGYGADREVDMLKAVTGRKPRVVGDALLENYELRVQSLDEVTGVGLSAQKRLRKSWGDSFRSYVIVPKPGAVVSGTLFRITLHDRHMIDEWEMVDIGWYNKIFVPVRLVKSGRTVRAETQVLGPNQNATIKADGLNYSSWLQPKEQFMQIAAGLAK